MTTGPMLRRHILDHDPGQGHLQHPSARYATRMSTRTPSLTVEILLSDLTKWNLARASGCPIPSLKNLDLRNSDLSAADLSGADLSGANLSGSDLCGTRLRDSNLSKANLDHADLGWADLRGAHIPGGALFGARMCEAQLSQANLCGADLRMAELEFADLEDADLRDADLTNADLSRVQGMRVNMNRANLMAANLVGAQFPDANLSRAQLSGADLRWVNLSGANMEGASIIDADMDGADLSALTQAPSHLGYLSKWLDRIRIRGTNVSWKAIAKDLHNPRLHELLIATGMPEVLATYTIDSLRSIHTTDLFRMLQSVFISYGNPDTAFAQKLQGALERNGVRTWLWARDAIPGSKLHREIRLNIGRYERVILICSQDSLPRGGVLHEIEKVLQREAIEGGSTVLLPITLDDAVFAAKWAPEGRQDLRDEILERVVGDFRGAVGSEQKFQEGLRRLLIALKKPR